MGEDLKKKPKCVSKVLGHHMLLQQLQCSSAEIYLIIINIKSFILYLMMMVESAL